MAKVVLNAKDVSSIIKSYINEEIARSLGGFVDLETDENFSIFDKYAEKELDMEDIEISVTITPYPKDK